MNLLRLVCDRFFNWQLWDIVTFKQKVDGENGQSKTDTYKPLLNCESKVTVDFESNASKSQQENLKEEYANHNYDEEIISSNAREDV